MFSSLYYETILSSMPETGSRNFISKNLFLHTWKCNRAWDHYWDNLKVFLFQILLQTSLLLIWNEVLLLNNPVQGSVPAQREYSISPKALKKQFYKMADADSTEVSKSSSSTSAARNFWEILRKPSVILRGRIRRNTNARQTTDLEGISKKVWFNSTK